MSNNGDLSKEIQTEGGAKKDEISLFSSKAKILSGLGSDVMVLVMPR